MFERPRTVEAARRWYEDEDISVLPRNISSPKVFRNAMALDVAMGGSTNTVLHTPGGGAGGGGVGHPR